VDKRRQYKKMVEVCLDELDLATELCREKMEIAKEYIKHIKTIPEHKRTIRQKELLVRFEERKINPKG
jgi:hypothetical protein